MIFCLFPVVGSREGVLWGQRDLHAFPLSNLKPPDFTFLLWQPPSILVQTPEYGRGAGLGHINYDPPLRNRAELEWSAIDVRHIPDAPGTWPHGAQRRWMRSVSNVETRQKDRRGSLYMLTFPRDTKTIVGEGRRGTGSPGTTAPPSR